MMSFPKTRSFLFPCLILFLFSLNTLLSQSAEGNLVRVVAIQGHVKMASITDKTKNLSLKLGRTFSEGQNLETRRNSSVALLLANDSVLTLAESSTLSVRKYRSGFSYPAIPVFHASLTRGSLSGKFVALGNHSDYRIMTPAGIVTLSNSRFSIAMNKEAGKLIIEISNIAGDLKFTPVSGAGGNPVPQIIAAAQKLRITAQPNLSNPAGPLFLKMEMVPLDSMSGPAMAKEIRKAEGAAVIFRSRRNIPPPVNIDSSVVSPIE